MLLRSLVWLDIKATQPFPWKPSTKLKLWFRGVVIIYCMPESILVMPIKCTVSWLCSLGTFFFKFYYVPKLGLQC